MAYKSPIEIMVGEVDLSVDSGVMKVVQKCNIQVDKNELVKALAYDRDQYKKGYRDGAESGEQDWIPVSEGLPKESDDYLVTIYFGGYGIHETDYACFNIETSEWSFHGRYDEYFLDENEITAWMPLPKPYGVNK